MTIQQLFYAITITEVGSMNRAAENLFITQPTLTKAIKELENELGFSLFVRSGKGMLLTPEGREFIIYAKQVSQQYEVLKDRFIGTSKRKRRFGISTQHYSFAIKAFTEFVKDFDLEKYEFVFRETMTRDVIDDVGSMKSDIGILFISEYNRKVIEKKLRDNDLHFTPLIDCKACVYITKTHPLADHDEITMEDLAPYPCLTFEQGDGDPIYYAEEILAEKDYPRRIKVCDRGSGLNLMNELNGYTLCSGIICDDVNGQQYKMIRFKGDGDDAVMHIGYITKNNIELGSLTEGYIGEIKKILDLK
ncbi:MAG: LysR family transcriptional regulator [Clostridiales bacterium]|nr:LysR family transcriptional regulator [Clostridiales bacterium]MBP5775421.1 LysR family transcriptional regulator [Clostridiales bacterium]